MKPIIATLFSVMLGINGNAQYLNLKEFTVQAFSILYIESDEPESASTNQVYVVSFTDKIPTHVIYTNGSISASQTYQMENESSYMNGESAIYKFKPYLVYRATDV